MRCLKLDDNDAAADVLGHRSVWTWETGKGEEAVPGQRQIRERMSHSVCLLGGCSLNSFLTINGKSRS